MPENHSRANKRVERLFVTDEPHERYSNINPVTGASIDNEIPILTKTPIGFIIDKNIENNVVHCPDCDIPARYTHDDDPVCPRCGLICSGKDGELEPEIIIDAKSAGRVEADDCKK